MKVYLKQSYNNDSKKVTYHILPENSKMRTFHIKNVDRQNVNIEVALSVVSGLQKINSEEVELIVENKTTRYLVCYAEYIKNNSYKDHGDNTCPKDQQPKIDLMVEKLSKIQVLLKKQLDKEDLKAFENMDLVIQSINCFKKNLYKFFTS